MAVFDQIANYYDSWYETKMGSFVDEVETRLAFRLFKPEKGMKILDIGCGTGNFSIKLAKMGCNVTGIDISEEMLNIAKAKASAEGLDIKFQKMDLYNMVFESESFDAVFSMAAFEFICEPEKAMDEIFRVVKKGGSILIGTIHRTSKWGELYLSKEYQENSVFKYACFKSLEELIALKAENHLSHGECLFIPPNAKEEDINLAKEEELKHTERGGYICALWKK